LFNKYNKDLETKAKGLNKNKKEELVLDYKVSGYIWYNQDIADIDEIGITIRNEAVFLTQEYKTTAPYKRYENGYYDGNGAEVIELKKSATSKSQLKKISVNGIKGFSPLRSLPYIKYDSDINQDPAHVLFVCALMILNIWKCDKENYRMFKAGVKEYYKNFEFENVFDCLWDDKVVIPWNFNNDEQMRVEAYLKCLLIPRGSISKFKIVNGNIFKQKGIIKGSGKITIISVYMKLVLFANSHMSIGYRALFRIFSNLFSRIRSKKILKTSIMPLFRRFNELRSLWEGYIPITEMIQMVHALEDITMHIPKQGPISGFNALHGEQAIGFVKNLSHTKGSSRPELQSFRKAASIEFANAKEFYSKLDSDRRASTGSSYLYWNTTGSTYVYNSERQCFEGISEDVIFNSAEFNSLLELFYRYIFCHYNCNKLEAISNSSLFRIIKLAKSSRDKSIITFLERLIDDADHIIDHNDDKDIRNNRLLKYKIYVTIPTNGDPGILISDIKYIRQILEFNESKMAFIIYKRVLLPFSITLRGRGFKYSENNKASDEIRNTFNNLETFYEQDQYSSWCKLSLERLNKVKDLGNKEEFYGQANYFFQFSINEESNFPDYFILKNLKCASVVSY
jgi:hypothetical protein